MDSITTILADPTTSSEFDTGPADHGFGCDNEYARLERVLLAEADQLHPVPCNSITRETLRNGNGFSNAQARQQHRALAAALRAEGVAVDLLPASADLADLCFTRDTSLMTPWGLVGLAPGAGHRRSEVDAVLGAARRAGVPILGRVESGRIEGGDVCLVRPGLIAIGISGDRTDEAGAEALARIFRIGGWQTLFYRFDPFFLHLDTQFCMVDRNLAVACVDVLGDDFLAELDRLGIGVVPVGYREQRRLGCNLVALGDRRVLTAGTAPRVDGELARLGYRIVSVDLSELTACGGGVHCLTMPLQRAPG